MDAGALCMAETMKMQHFGGTGGLTMADTTKKLLGKIDALEAVQRSGRRGKWEEVHTDSKFRGNSAKKQKKRCFPIVGVISNKRKSNRSEWRYKEEK